MPLAKKVRLRYRELFPRQDHTAVQNGQDEAASTSALPFNTSNVPNGLPERLWDHAYDELKISDAALVQAYEKILTRKLSGQGFGSPVTTSDQNIIAQHDTDARRIQMRQLIQEGLDKTAGEARIKQAFGAAFVLYAKDRISAAIQAMPQAALPWTGICVGLEMIQSPIFATEANRRGIEYVLKRMDWYWKLASAVLDDSADESCLSGVRQELETRVIDLYAKLLSYEMKSVCSYYRNRGLALLRDIAGLDNWTGDMNAIQTAERAFYDDSNAYASLKMVSDLDQLVSRAETQSNVQLAKEDQQCIQDLRLTDPFDDKSRIEQTKGGLLQDSYSWILENAEYQQWRGSDEDRLLWIKGDPGKGKTMLLCGIINELGRKSSRPGLVSYFFCQATDQQLNNATAVLRGLIFMLVSQQPSLVSHVRKRYDQAGSKLFEGANTWVAVSDILKSILQDPALKGAYLVVDALDECVSDQEQLLDLIVRVSDTAARVKWIVSSRNLPQIEEYLQLAEQKVRLSLELNAEAIASAVKIYIGDKVQRLSNMKGYDNKTRDQVRDYLLKNANDTFLWVALVCQNLEKYARWKVLDMLNAFPPGLESLYKRIMAQVLEGDESDVRLCKQILLVMMSVYRPISLRELGSLVEINQELSDDVQYLEHIVSLCGSFLTIREETIYFVHQSAKDYLSKYEDANLASGLRDVHQTMVSLSLQAMTRLLKKNIYELSWLGLLSDNDNHMPEPDPLSAIRYSCVHWVDHLYLMQIASGSSDCTIKIWDITTGACIQTLEGHTGLVNTVAFTADSRRIVSGSNDRSIKIWDLTTGACHRTLSGHTGDVEEIAVLNNDQVASASYDATIKIWDIKTGSCLQTLGGHTGQVSSVAPLAGGLVASGGKDGTIKIWDVATGLCNQTLEGHTNSVNSVTPLSNGQLISDTGACVQTLVGHAGWANSVHFLPDGRLASGSDDRQVKLWDVETGACVRTFEGHTNSVTSVASSADGQRIASTSLDRTVRIWDTATAVSAVAFSMDGQWVAVGSTDGRIVIYDEASQSHCTLREHSDQITAVAVSPDGLYAVSGAFDKTVKVWHVATGKCVQKFHLGTRWDAQLSFDPTMKYRIRGEFGYFDLDLQSLDFEFEEGSDNTRSEDESDPVQSSRPPVGGYGIDGRDGLEEWIRKDGKPLLWLPPEYRSEYFAVAGSTVAVCVGGTRVSFFKFSEAGPDS
ncbi:hypothetical protein MKX07_003567 [Trichoderma sp. CBMAI-0711]|nr:hypothetical protein MKX07_003567 [Trichoderma sp. CBMAI-0711]